MMNIKLNRPAVVCTVLLLAFGATGCASYGPPENGEVSGPEKRVSGPVENIEEIVLELPTGDVEVEAIAGSSIDARLEIRCDRYESSCLRLADSVKMKKQVFENRMYIAPTTQSKFAFRKAQSDYRITVPDNVPLRIIMGYGALSVKGIRSHLDVSMKAGEVSVEAPLSEVRKVWADANFGDASLKGAGSGASGERRLLVGAEANWDQGPGAHDIIVNLGAGDVNVNLTSP